MHNKHHAQQAKRYHEMLMAWQDEVIFAQYTAYSPNITLEFLWVQLNYRTDGKGILFFLQTFGATLGP